MQLERVSKNVSFGELDPAGVSSAAVLVLTTDGAPRRARWTSGVALAPAPSRWALDAAAERVRAEETFGGGHTQGFDVTETATDPVSDSSRSVRSHHAWNVRVKSEKNSRSSLKHLKCSLFQPNTPV